MELGENIRVYMIKIMLIMYLNINYQLNENGVVGVVEKCQIKFKINSKKKKIKLFFRMDYVIK